jgi:hypothetical protein
LEPADDKSNYYNANYLSPNGESGKWLAQGGFLRQRPLPVSPGPSSTYLVDNMMKEVALAMAGGITGFTVDVLDKTEVDAGSQLQNLLTAAAAVDSRFNIVVMPDLSALGADAATVESIIESVAKSPAAYHLADGRLVVSAFDASLGSVSFWQVVFSEPRVPRRLDERDRGRGRLGSARDVERLLGVERGGAVHGRDARRGHRHRVLRPGRLLRIVVSDR